MNPQPNTPASLNEAVACRGKNCGTTTGDHSPECFAEHEAAYSSGGNLDTPGNREPESRYRGYKGTPLDSGASADQHAAWEEGRRASQPGCAVEGEALSPATVAQPVANRDALMKLSQFAHTAAHMSERECRNNLLSIADQLIALAGPDALECERCGLSPEAHTPSHFCANQSFAAQPCASQGCGGAVDRKAEALRWCAAALQAVSPSLHADSLFVMLGTKEEKTLEEVLDLADAALSTAKSGGGATPEGGGE